MKRRDLLVYGLVAPVAFGPALAPEPERYPVRPTSPMLPVVKANGVPQE
jgi:hypothetical protein